MKKITKLRLAAIAAGSAVVGSASAAVPLAVSTALTDGAADAATVAGLFLVAVIGIAMFKLMGRGAH